MTPTTRLVELAALVNGLPARQRRGSRPRCVLLTHGTVHRVADRLSALAAPALVVNSDDAWAPHGFDRAHEVALGNCPEALLGRREQQTLTRWWLATRGRLPTWDLVATGRAGARNGLLLIEAKAHAKELLVGRRWPISAANQASITRALDEASAALDAALPGWDLRRAPYQLANRIAWAWKLASLGIPTVLVYLGFLGASEMVDRGAWFPDQDAWERAMRAHAQLGVPDEAWGRRLVVGDAWLQLELRTTHVPLPGVPAATAP